MSERSVGPLTLTDFVRFAGAVGDFNPMHHDDEHARRHGHPGVFGMGMFAAGLAGDVLLAHFGGSVRDWTARFVERVWPGEILTAELDDLASDDQVRFVVRSESGPKVTGHARIAEAGLSEIERATDDVDRSVDSPRSDVVFPVEAGKIRELARALQSSNQDHFDSDVARSHGFVDLLAPLTITACAAHWDTGDATAIPAAIGLDVPRVVHGSNRWVLTRPVVAGDVLHGRRRIARSQNKVSKSGSPMRFVDVETQFRDAQGVAVVTETMTIVELAAAAA